MGIRKLKLTKVKFAETSHYQLGQTKVMDNSSKCISLNLFIYYSPPILIHYSEIYALIKKKN